MIEVGGVHESTNHDGALRHRHRFATGRLTLAPFEIDAQVYGFDRSRAHSQAPLWVTTFVGEPRRFDIPIAIGSGLSLGRLHYRRGAQGDLMLQDMGEGHINWEFYQGERLENYFLITTGAGLGVIHRLGSNQGALYAAPDVGLRAAWTLTENGLTQLAMHGRIQ